MSEANGAYIHKCKNYINFMLSQQQWSGLTKDEVLRWLENFKELDSSDKILVYKLLTNLIYYSEKDVIDALREGIKTDLYYEFILKKQKETDFSLSPHALNRFIREELQKTCFIPLSDSGAPHESGNYVTRLLVSQGLIDSSQSMFANDIVPRICDRKFSRVVIVDDCVGSGDQLRNFWTDTMILVGQKQIYLREFCEQYSVSVAYLTLFGYDQSIEMLKKEFKDLKICCVRLLSNQQRVFMENSYVWENDEERKRAFSLFENITHEKGIALYGYADLDFAFIMHQTIPDWSLPMLWKQNADWNLLMRRKNSDA